MRQSTVSLGTPPNLAEVMTLFGNWGVGGVAGVKRVVSIECFDGYVVAPGAGGHAAILHRGYVISGGEPGGCSQVCRRTTGTGRDDLGINYWTGVSRRTRWSASAQSVAGSSRGSTDGTSLFCIARLQFACGDADCRRERTRFGELVQLRGAPAVGCRKFTTHF